MMDEFIGIATVFFLVSGILAWAIVLIATWYYWLCLPKEGL
jgi:hypothetical protein